MKGLLAHAFLLFAVFLSPLSAQAQETGSIAGTLVDSETGDPLIGANAQVPGTSLGAATDVQGRYRIEGLEPGAYDLAFSYVGYQKKTVTGVEVAAGETTTLDVQLTPANVEMGEVTVEARVIRNNEAALLNERQKAVSLSNAVSARSMSRAGAGDAAEAMEQVTGASVVGGKYVQVRGLGGRYMNAQLNGSNLPSSDPDRKAVQFDMFPADLLSNIVTTKTSTPDQPGSFTGGNVNINTKAYPSDLTVSFSASSKYNSQVGYGDDVLLFRNGGAGRFGMNGKAHRMPGLLQDILNDPKKELPTRSAAATDAGLADTLSRISRGFSPVMGPSRVAAPTNQSYSASVGNEISLLGRPLGFVGSFSYSREASGYTDGVEAQYALPGSAEENEGLFTNYILSAEVDSVNGIPVNGFSAKGTDEVLWGGLLTATYQMHPNHEVGLTYMRNQSGTATARQGVGRLPRDLGSEDVWEVNELSYVERRVSSYQAEGTHALGANGDVQINWNGALSQTRQDEPDHRYFLNDRTLLRRGGEVESFYNIRPANYPRPTRLFRTLEEDNWNGDLDVTLPFTQWSGRTAELKIGGAYANKARTFSEESFIFHPKLNDSLKAVHGNPTAFYAPHNVGVIDTTGTAENPRFEFGNYISNPGNANDYEADQETSAGFVMLEIPVTARLRAIGGVRFEATRMSTVNTEKTEDDSTARGALDTNDWLPSLNLVYQLRDNMNLRGSYGRTLARPTFREFAPYSSFQYPSRTYIGNLNLKRTLVDNVDLRWEWFTRPGEILAVSGFYKYFKNPIEDVILNSNYDVQPQNVDFARVYGLEVEMRQKLDQVSSLLRHVEVGGNLTLTQSSVSIDSTELAQIRTADPDAESTRPLQDQSPYVVNAHLSYDNPTSGTSVNVSYNVFGERLNETALFGTPDIYEQPRHVIDVTAKQSLGRGFTLKASADNLLNDPYIFSHSFKGEEYVARRYRSGRTFSLGVSYEL